MTEFSDDIDAAMDDLMEEAGQQVTFVRGNGHEVQLVARRGHTEFHVDSSDGAAIVERSIDFIVKMSALLDDETAFRPVQGEKIVVGTQEYLCHPFKGQACWRFTGNTQHEMRIHTQLIRESL